MASRHILYLTNENVVSLVARGGRIAGRKVFPVSGAGQADFEAHVKALRHVPTHLITDLAEEDFRADTIPHLGRRDQEAVLARKLSQIFRNTTYRHAIAQGREAEGRRDDRVIYTAITNAEVLRPWLEVIERLEVPFEGIHSSAVFSGRLLEQLHLQFPHTLLVTFTPGDALRQTYFRNREIKFSRLTPVDLQEGESLGGLVSSEVGRTWQYLDSLRNFQSTDRLEVCVLVHPKDRPAVEPVLRDYDQIEYRLLDMEQVAGKLGLKPPPLASSAEEVLAHLFAQKPGANDFAPPELRRFAVIRNARNAIGTVAGVFLAAGLAYAGWNLSGALANREVDLQTARRIQAAQREYDEVTRSTPAMGVGGQTMRDTVAFFSSSLRQNITVTTFLVPISTVLDKYPAIRLTQVAWEAADDDKVLPALTPILPKVSPPLKALTRGSEASPASTPRALGAVPETPFSSGRHSVAVLEATVNVEGVDYRSALALVEGFVADIGKLPGYRADILDSPLDITPRSAIKGQSSDQPHGQSQARFSVKVSRATEPRT
ncbi:MAG: hypothetical protein KIS74_12630 [Burkholderiales bacterium]|nr:hypothetical protein [Burkholderiales bacterium]